MTNVVPMSRPLRLALLADAAASGVTAALLRCGFPRKLVGVASGADAWGWNGSHPIGDSRYFRGIAAGDAGQPCGDRGEPRATFRGACWQDRFAGSTNR